MREQLGFRVVIAQEAVDHMIGCRQFKDALEVVSYMENDFNRMAVLPRLVREAVKSNEMVLAALAAEYAPDPGEQKRLERIHGEAF